MKFRILRDYDEYRPQVWVEPKGKLPYWEDIGMYRCEFIESAEEVCVQYKRMIENPIVKEFEL